MPENCGSVPSTVYPKDDCYPLQYSRNGGGYTVVKEKLTDQIVLDHLRGIKTIGLYGSPHSTSKWLCVDIDDLDEIAVREVQNHARRFKAPYLTEFSGKKGYHLWVFFDRPYPNRIVRALAEAFAFDNEVFPKQNHIGKGKLGNLVKAPLGKHQATGNWCLFLDKNLKPEKDQYGTLATIQTINPIHILKRSMPETWAKLTMKKSIGAEPKKAVTLVRVPIIKDCIRNAIIKGAEEGSRNQIGHIIASELRSLGFSKSQAETILSSMWNPQNKPQLEESEIKLIINSAYGNQEYVYRCKENSPLRQNLECVGPEKCLYMSAFKVLQERN